MTTQNTKNNQCGMFGLTCQTRKYPVFGILFGMMFPIIAWVFDLIYRGYGLSKIGQMHMENPMHFIIDMAPVMLGLTAYLLALKIQKDQSKLETYINVREAHIQKVSDFAEEIGNGNYNADVNSDVDKSSPLIKILFKLKNDLLSSSTQKKEQNWEFAGKEKISNILMNYSDLKELSYNVLVELINYTSVIQGAFYIYDKEKDVLVNYASYAYNRKKHINQEFKIGEGLIGQAAYELDTVYRKEIPDNYATITSGILGEKKPGSLLIVPLINDEKLEGVIELAAIEDEIPIQAIKFIENISEPIAQTLFSLIINTKTKELLEESQRMTTELRENEEELNQNAEEMIATQEELQKSNIDLEGKIKEVQDAQTRQQTLLTNASEVITIYDENGIIKYESPSVINILGYSHEETVGTNSLNRISEETKDRVSNAIAELIKKPLLPVTVEFQYYKKDGSLIWLESYGKNLLDNHIINGILFNTRDITERKLIEKEQRRSGQMQALSENSPDLIMRFNLEKKLYYANPIFEQYMGVSTEEAKDKNINELNIDESISEFVNKTIDKIKEKNEQIEEEFVINNSLGKRFMLINAMPELNEEGDLETALIVAHDITERKEIEIEIENTNKKITESINYAKRIQNSILPKTINLQEHFKKSFMLYKPKDVVSGDFPWMFDKGDNLYFAAVDCTGHGVPGALLSFIGYFQLNNIVDHAEILDSGEILDKFHYGVRKTLRQEEDGANSRDGMDVAFCRYEHKKKKLYYAGAHRPLYLLRNGKLQEFKGDRKAIGGIPHKKKKEKDFTNYVIDIKTGDKIFIFSDGYPDQIGGPDKKKYQAKQIRKGILDNNKLSMTEYKDFFDKEYKNWKGDNKQIDDIIMIGVEF